MSVRRWLHLCLGLQALIGAAVVVEASGLLTEGRWRLTAPPAIVPGEPVRPEDQTRRYRPADLPPAPAPMRPALPGLPAPADLPERLTIETVARDGGTALSLTGRIDAGAADRLADRLAALATPPERILLHSPGGLVDEALALGRTIRAAGLPTAVPDGAVCLSACPYLLAGGTERAVSARALVGVHQSYYDRSVYLPLFLGVSWVQRGEAEAMRFLIEMGVDPLVRIPALETPAEDIYLLTADELVDYRLATEILPVAP